jgi:hypothetical protein
MNLKEGYKILRSCLWQKGFWNQLPRSRLPVCRLAAEAYLPELTSHHRTIVKNWTLPTSPLAMPPEWTFWKAVAKAIFHFSFG